MLNYIKLQISVRLNKSISGVCCKISGRFKLSVPVCISRCQSAVENVCECKVFVQFLVY
jgi:hypothetical protein